jgi:hypothetical protein
MDFQDMSEALLLARKTSRPIGQMLKLSGKLTEIDLNNALQAQEMIRDKHITGEFGIAVLKAAHADGTTFQEALKKHGWQNIEEKNLSEMAELLITAELISDQDLQKAIERSEKVKQPVGTSLMSMGLISTSVLAAALTALVFVRNNRINHEAAVRALRTTVNKGVSLEQALIMDRAYFPDNEHSVRLGELLGMAGLVAESENLSAVEKGLSVHQPLGRILSESGLVPMQLVESALDLQQKVADGEMNARQASDLLKFVQKTGVSVPEALEYKKQKGTLSAELLRIASLVNDADIERAKGFPGASKLDLSQCLYDAMIIDQFLYNAASRCVDLIENNILQIEDAVVLLQYCAENQTSVELALQQQVWRLQAKDSTQNPS